MIKLTIYIKHCGDCPYLYSMKYSTGYPQFEDSCGKDYEVELSFIDVPRDCPINIKSNEIY